MPILAQHIRIYKMVAMKPASSMKLRTLMEHYLISTSPAEDVNEAQKGAYLPPA